MADAPGPGSVAALAGDGARVAVIGLGNELRHDDAAGLEVVRALRGRGCARGVRLLEHEGEPLTLLELWRDLAAVVLVDAINAGAQAGTVHRIDASVEPIPPSPDRACTTHAVGLEETLELARALGRLPARAIVYALEGERFDIGRGLSEAVRAAVEPLADAVVEEAGALAASR